MNDQAYKLRKQAWQSNRNCHYIAVSSGKGGVGKSNFSVNMAYNLAQLGKRVLLFDADLGLANIDIMLSISVTSTVKKYLEDRATIDDILKKDVYGFDVFPASSGFVELTSLSDKEFDKIFGIFMALDSRYDYIIFDTGAGISDAVIRFASIADTIMVVTNPEPTAITDAYALIKVISGKYDLKSMYIVFNRVDDIKVANNTYKSLKGVVSKFLSVDLKLLGHIRDDKSVSRAVRSQKPVSITEPKAYFSIDVADCVRNFMGLPVVKKRNDKVYDLFRGVFK